MASPSAEVLTGDPEGVVLRIERSSIHDGAGLRTVVFLKGCSLSCSWCSTPESLQFQPERGYLASRCKLCGACVEACPAKALRIEDGLKLDDSSCRHCFSCVAACPEQAVRKYGSRMSASQVVEEISRDEIFYFHSGGGVTLSGGECLQQPEFVRTILEECRSRGIDTAMETSLFAPWPIVAEVLPFVDTLFIDLKHSDPTKHLEHTGADNSLILENLKKLDKSEYSGEVHLRIPLIPGINDSNETLVEMLEIASELGKIVEVEILPYHRLGRITYDWLGKTYRLGEVQPPSPAYIEERVGFLRNQKMVTVPIRAGGGFGLES